MKGTLAALAATLAAYAPGAQAQTGPIDGSSALPLTVQVPATVRGKNGPPTRTNLDFKITDFKRGKHGTLCAVGTLSGNAGATVIPETPVSTPATANGVRGNPSDCQGDDGDDHEGGFGLLERPGPNATPAAATALGLVQPAPFVGTLGGAIVPAATCTILNLAIAPIHLNLLGLIVDTSLITLDITANPALGLLGNLLCGLLGP